MKVTTEPPEPQKPDVVIELTWEEAYELYILAANAQSSFSDKLYSLLNPVINTA